MIRRRLYAFVDFAELRRQGILLKEFPPHDWNIVQLLTADIADFRKFWTIFKPSCRIDEQIREYLGEELAFYFVYSSYTREMTK